jgi:hypothetical protein
MDETTKDRFFAFVERHKVAITATVTAVATTATCVALSHLANNQSIDFIKEHGLYDEYLTAGEE